MDYFSNASDVRRVGDFELQNRLDRITIGGGSITRDEAGLATARALAEHLHQIQQQLLADRAAGKLPKATVVKPDAGDGKVFRMAART
jgi:hypothetical protein